MHLDLVVHVHLASFSSDAVLQQFVQSNLPTLRGTAACDLQLSVIHPTDEEVVEPLVAAAGRSGRARRPLPTEIAEVACIVRLSARAKLLASRCILAPREALKGHQVVEQAVQHCLIVVVVASVPH